MGAKPLPSIVLAHFDDVILNYACSYEEINKSPGYWQNYFKPETEKSVNILARICQILKTKQWPADGKYISQSPRKEMPRSTTSIGPSLWFPTQAKRCLKWCDKAFYYLIRSKKCWMFKVDSEKEDYTEDRHSLKTGMRYRISEG